MQILNIGSIYNLNSQTVTVPIYNAVGLAVISAAFPKYTQISAIGGGQSNIPLLRGQKLWLPAREAYYITYPDTFVGFIDAYGRYDNFDVNAPPYETEAKGILRAIVFQEETEIENYMGGRLEDVVFIPRLAGLESGSQLYGLHNLDFDSMTMQIKNATDGYYNSFRVEEGNEINPADLDNFTQRSRIQLGYLTAPYLNAANESNGGFLNLTNAGNIRIHQIASDATLSSQRAFMYMRFQDGQGLPAAGKRQGKSVFKAIVAVPVSSTRNVDIPLMGSNTWSLTLTNVGLTSVTTRAFRMMQRPDNNVYIDTASDVLASAVQLPGASRTANNFSHGQADILRISLTNALGSPDNIMILLTGYI